MSCRTFLLKQTLIHTERTIPAIVEGGGEPFSQSAIQMLPTKRDTWLLSLIRTGAAHSLPASEWLTSLCAVWGEFKISLQAPLSGSASKVIPPYPWRWHPRGSVDQWTPGGQWCKLHGWQARLLGLQFQEAPHPGYPLVWLSRGCYSSLLEEEKTPNK